MLIETSPPLNEGSLPAAEVAAPTWKQKQRQVREEAILDAARILIAENGYESMTMEDLAEYVGISKPTLYQHFPSKEIIAVRAVVAFVERSIQWLRELDPERTAIDRLRTYVRWMMSQRFSPDHIIFCGVKVALVPIVRTNPEYQAARQRILDLLLGIVEEAKADGSIEIGLSTRALIQILFSLVRDTEYEQLIASGDVTPEELSETLCSVYLGGICKTNE